MNGQQTRSIIAEPSRTTARSSNACAQLSTLYRVARDDPGGRSFSAPELSNPGDFVSRPNSTEWGRERIRRFNSTGRIRRAQIRTKKRDELELHAREELPQGKRSNAGEREAIVYSKRGCAKQYAPCHGKPVDTSVKQRAVHDEATTLIESEERFSALNQIWNRLAQTTDPQSVFLRHEWFEAAWQWAQADSQLAIFLLESNEASIGILPLVRRTRRRHSIAFRALEFLTVPDTQLCDVLASPNDHDFVLGKFAEALARNITQWDVVTFSHLREDSALVKRLPGKFEELGLGAITVQSGLNRTVNLDQDWESYYRGRSRGLKKNNNLVANRLARAGGVEIEWIHGVVDASRAENCLEHLVGISAASWKNRTGLTLNHPGPARFIRRLTEHAAAQGWLSVWLLALAGKPTAMEYQLNYAGSVHALRSDFDDASKSVSPGSHLNWKVLEGLFGCSAKRYYMGAGDNAYKELWANEGEPVYEITVYNRTVSGYSLKMIDQQVRPLLRRWT
jgi:CelD/BcsL family acetyltransferase involved in cellulose biosynthesis